MLVEEEKRGGGEGTSLFWRQPFLFSFFVFFFCFLFFFYYYYYYCTYFLLISLTNDQHNQYLSYHLTTQSNSSLPSDLELREGERRIRKKRKKKRKIFSHWFAKVKFHCCRVLMFLCGKIGKEKGKT